MPIQTNFRFDQIRDKDNLDKLAASPKDLLDNLRSFIGQNHSRTWSGPGFNLIWRPHNKAANPTDPNKQDFFLELDITKECLSFTDITGVTGIANRGLLQGDVTLGGLAYQQEVTNVTVVPNKPLHFEPGVWINVPNTTNPTETGTVCRMGSIPHGTTINAQGTSSISKEPDFKPVSILPFTIGSPDDGVTDIFKFPEGISPLANNLSSRTQIADLVGLTDAHFQNPITILSDVTKRQNILSTTVFKITTDVTGLDTQQAPNPGSPHEGGGIDSIGFLVGSAAGPNANAAKMTATFWVEKIKADDGSIFFQLQYIQRVLLNFNKLSWPHISLATMVITDEKQ